MLSVVSKTFLYPRNGGMLDSIKALVDFVACDKYCEQDLLIVWSIRVVLRKKSLWRKALSRF